MRRWNQALPALLTALTVLVLTVLPPQLSGLADRRLEGAVHGEAMGDNSNFPIQPPALPDRLRLLAQYRCAPGSLAAASQAMETPRQRAEADALARAALAALTEAGVLSGELPAFTEGFTADRLCLRDPWTLSSAGFLLLEATDRREYRLNLVLDLETRRAVHVQLLGACASAADQSPEEVGTRFLQSLDLPAGGNTAAGETEPYTAELSLPACPGLCCRASVFRTLLSCSLTLDQAAQAALETEKLGK